MWIIHTVNSIFSWKAVHNSKSIRIDWFYQIGDLVNMIVLFFEFMIITHMIQLSTFFTKSSSNHYKICLKISIFEKSGPKGYNKALGQRDVYGPIWIIWYDGARLTKILIGKCKHDITKSDISTNYKSIILARGLFEISYFGPIYHIHICTYMSSS